MHAFTYWLISTRNIMYLVLNDHILPPFSEEIARRKIDIRVRNFSEKKGRICRDAWVFRHDKGQ